MKNQVFGEIIFHFGWELPSQIIFFGKTHNVIINAEAYDECEMITTEQENAYAGYLKNRTTIWDEIENLVANFVGGADIARERFNPKMLRFEKNGSYALICDDKENEEDGIAVCLTPDRIVLPLEEYL